MRRIISILITIVMIAGAMYVPVFAADSTASLSANKTEYKYGENIIVTASGGTQDAWVGIYGKDDTPGSGNGTVSSYFWYWSGEDWSSGKEVIIQKQTSGNRASILPAGEYKILLFNDSGYNVIKTVNITITEDSAGGDPETEVMLTSISYDLDNKTDGLANGTVTVTADSESAAGINCIMYWADSEGVPLEGYTPLAKFRLIGETTNHDMYDFTIIPEGAEKLTAYILDNGKPTGDPVSADLPDNCNYVIQDDYNVEFQLISDIHIQESDSSIHNTRFTQMLEDVKAYSPDSIGIFVNGDIADNGRQAQYEKLVSLYNTVKNKGGIPDLHLAIGNHDWYDGNPDGQFQKYAKLVNSSLVKQPETVYYDETVAGYHFIYLGGEQSGGNATLSADQLSWFDSRMAEITEEDHDKPVFVLLHQPLYNTVAGSLPGQGWHGVNDEQKLRNILRKYPQIIIAGGHSHWELDSEINMYPGDDNMSVAVNTASVAYLWSSYNTAGGEHADGSNGYYVRVYDDKVIFMGRDIENSRFVSSAMFVVEKNAINTPKDEYTIDINDDEAELGAVFNDGTNVKYESSNTSVVSVSPYGKLTPLKNGTAEITITAYATDKYVRNQKKVTVTVTGEAEGGDDTGSETPPSYTPTETFLELYTDENATTTATEYIHNSKGTPVYIRANCGESNEDRPWIGLYDGALTCDTWNRNQASLVWAYAEEAIDQQTNIYNGNKAFDITSSGNYIKYQGEFDGKLNPGTYTVILFKDYNNYIPLAYKQFAVRQDVSGAKVVVSETKFTYNGKVQAPEVTSAGGYEYDASIPDNSIDAGTYKVTVNFKGLYYGKSNASYTIEPKQLTAESINVEDVNDQGYTGDEITPAIVVKDGNTTLQDGKDYNVEYIDNTEIGQATVTITGNGNYEGSVTKQFNIIFCQHTEWEDADCGKPRTCKKCGKTEGEALPHDWNEGEVTIPPTCTEKGVKTYTCKNDATHTKTEDVAVDAEAHDWNEGKITTSATCTVKGVKTYECLRNGCNEIKTEDVGIDPKKHNFKVQRVVEPTCDNHGYTIFVCECGSTRIADYTDPSKHTEVIDARVEATYESTGLTEGKHCSACGKTLVAQEVIPVLVYSSAPSTATAQLRTVTGGYDDVKVTWSKASGAAGYVVYYKKATAKSCTKLVTTTGTTATKKNLLDGVKYTFKVVPYVKSGDDVIESSGFKTSSVTTLKRISTPKVTKSGSKVKVSWKNINGETGYQISRAAKKKGTKVVSIFKSTTAKSKKITAKKGVKYYYKVRAYKNVKVGKKYVKVFAPWSYVKAYKR